MIYTVRYKRLRSHKQRHQALLHWTQGESGRSHPVLLPPVCSTIPNPVVVQSYQSAFKLLLLLLGPRVLQSQHNLRWRQNKITYKKDYRRDKNTICRLRNTKHNLGCSKVPTKHCPSDFWGTRGSLFTCSKQPTPEPVHKTSLGQCCLLLELHNKSVSTSV